MQHPFLQPVKHFYYYLSAWALIIAAHALLLIYKVRLSPLPSVSDALVFNITLSAYLLGLWYAVRYMRLDNAQAAKILWKHLLTAVIILSLWSFTGGLLLRLFFSGDADYVQFLDEATAVRFFAGLLYYCIILLLYYLYVYYISFKKNLVREATLETIVKETQLELLKSQLNPHFIFNSLNSISSLTITNPEKAQDMVIKLSSFLRYSLGHKEAHLVPLHKELENCLLYLEIEQIRFGNRLAFDNRIDDEAGKYLVPDMILQPLLENAIKHGVYESLEQIHVKLECRHTPEEITIRISNNYDPHARKKPGKGLGLRNVSDRLHLIYGKGSFIDINKTGQLFTVTLTIPQRP